MEIRPATAEEFPAFLRTTESAFHEDVNDDELARWRTVFEPERSLAVLDGSAMVATAAIFTRELTIPGGLLSVAGVTAVGVLASHRRRGLLTRLMRRQIDDVRAAGEPVAALWASEGAIYGRFGYGLAARHATVALRTAGARLHPDLPAPTGRTTLVEPAEAVPRIALRPLRCCSGSATRRSHHACVRSRCPGRSRRTRSYSGATRGTASAGSTSVVRPVGAGRSGCSRAPAVRRATVAWRAARP